MIDGSWGGPGDTADPQPFLRDAHVPIRSLLLYDRRGPGASLADRTACGERTLLSVPVSHEGREPRRSIAEGDVGHAARVRVLQEEGPRARGVDPDRVDPVAVPVPDHRRRARRAVGEGEIGGPGR